MRKFNKVKLLNDRPCGLDRKSIFLGLLRVAHILGNLVGDVHLLQIRLLLLHCLCFCLSCMHELKELVSVWEVANSEH